MNMSREQQKIISHIFNCYLIGEYKLRRVLIIVSSGECIFRYDQLQLWFGLVHSVYLLVNNFFKADESVIATQRAFLAHFRISIDFLSRIALFMGTGPSSDHILLYIEKIIWRH